VTALVGRIPRAFPSHRTPEGAAYGRYVRATLSRLGALPDAGRVWLKEAGRLTVALDRLHAETEAATAASQTAGRRQREKLRAQLRSLERRTARLRAALEATERRLEELAGENKPLDLARAIMLAQQQEAEA
jgi:septal ring factor EnvC (AmiA/AmiB activator)